MDRPTRVRKKHRQNQPRTENMNCEIKARCPVCAELSDMPADQVGGETICRNCKQVVRMVPLSTGQRQMRVVMRLAIVLMVTGVLAVGIYWWVMSEVRNFNALTAETKWEGYSRAK